MNAPALNEALDRAFPAATTAAPERARRDRALAAFARHGFPHRRLEDWRYTDLARLERADFSLATPEAPGEAALAAVRASLASLPYTDADTVAVYVDGRYANDLSRVPDALRRQLEQSAALPGQPVDADAAPRHALAALNAAFARPIVLELDAETLTRAGTLVFVFVAASPDVATQVRMDLRVDAGAGASIVHHHVAATGESAGWTNAVIDIDLAERSVLELIRVQELTPTQSLTALLRPRLAADARLEIGSVDVGGALVRTDIEVALADRGASAELFGLATAGGGRHVDNHVCADHLSPETRSRQTYRSIVDDGGRVVFNGKVVVRPDAQGIDAHQRSDNLLLARNAEVDTKPELEIYADDVRCSHGATIGELDEAELFYLQSRGVPAEAARKLLTFGFANRVLSGIRHEALRRYVGGRVSGVLSDAALPAADDLLLTTDEPGAAEEKPA